MEGETKDRAARKGAVVDLLATWGATALPGMADLLAVLAAFRQRGSVNVIQQLLDAPESALDGALRSELQGLADASRAGSAEGSTLIEQAAEALGKQARSEHEALGRRLGTLAPDLERTEFHEILESFWQGERTQDTEDRLRAVGQLHRAAGLLDKAEARIENEKRDHSDGPAATDDQALRAVRQRLAGTCERARQTAEQTGALLDATRRELLLGATQSGGALLRNTSRDDDSPAGERALARCERGLRVMLDDLADAGEPARRARAEASRRLIDRWRALAAGQDRPTEAADRLERRLEDGAASGGHAYYEALVRGTESIRSLQQGRADQVERAEARLSQSARSLERGLKKSAGVLPAARVIQARLLVEGAGAVVAVADPAGIDALATAIESETETVRGLAATAREQRANVVSSERSGAVEDAEGLIGWVGPSSAKRLRGLLASLERAGPNEIDAARDDLESAISGTRNGIRFDAARTLERAERRLARRKDGRAVEADSDAGRLESEVEALRDALDIGDPGSMVGGTRQVESALRKLAPWSRPPLRLALVAAGVLLIASLILVWQWSLNRTREYRLVLAQSSTISEPVTLFLVRDGKVAGQVAYESGESVAVKLSSGEYEIYVNGRYTGRVIRVPEDAPDVTEIPVP